MYSLLWFVHKRKDLDQRLCLPIKSHMSLHVLYTTKTNSTSISELQSDSSGPTKLNTEVKHKRARIQCHYKWHTYARTRKRRISFHCTACVDLDLKFAFCYVLFFYEAHACVLWSSWRFKKTSYELIQPLKGMNLISFWLQNGDQTDSNLVMWQATHLDTNTNVILS